MPATGRHSFIDQLLIAADEALRTLSGATSPARPSPGRSQPEGGEGALSAGLMRVNHSGEICAQALYSGQALFARDPRVRAALQAAAAEERDHLAWCRGRLRELGARPSVMDPLWYAGSYAIGAASGLAGDRWNLGFLAETERQVVQHLDGHLQRLSHQDAKSRAIIVAMKRDEARHATTALHSGGAELPLPFRAAMRLASRVMTTTAYWV